MYRKLSALLSFFVLMFFTACQAPEEEADLAMESARRAEAIYEDYFEQSKRYNPVTSTYLGEREYNGQFYPIISAENREELRRFEEDFLEQIRSVNPSDLIDQDLLSYQIFIYERKMALETMQFPTYMLPINQMQGVHNQFAQLGSGQGAQPFETVDDYRLFMQRANGFVRWLDSARNAMQEGIEKGVAHPDVVVKKLIPQFKFHLVDTVEESLFAGPIINSSLNQSELAIIKDEYLAMIENQLIPAYQRMHDFLEAEYLPASRQEIGLTDLTQGKAWYQQMIQVNTTLNYSPQEIHELGLKEVERILTEMKQVKETLAFEGDLAAFFEHLRRSDEFYFKSREDLVSAYDEVRKKINQLTPKLFNIFPKADYQVRLTEDFRAASSAGAEYQPPSIDGSRPGIFYINGYNLKAQPKFLLETLSIHEASPGHHFQISIQQELNNLPKFRRFGNYNVFSEGWALYAESLGKEMGLFTDPLMWYGRLSDEQLRALRLVVDTGIHAMGWTREQAIQYMLENSSMNETDIIAEVERYIVMPGQALGYKLGEFKIRELRNDAEQKLGQQFQIKAFHRQILQDGAMPMPILEEKLHNWIKSLQHDSI